MAAPVRRGCWSESLRANTFPSGINRELATDYHGFVFELGVFAALEAAARRDAGQRATLAAAVRDGRRAWPRWSTRGCGRPGKATPTRAAWCCSTPPSTTGGRRCCRSAARLFGRLDWWPAVTAGRGQRARRRPRCPVGLREVAGRPAARPSRFADAGITILRTASAARLSPEIWCRCDGGPHGFLSIAAHAHADALSVEVRYDGVDILADPGTYCYHGEPEWRSYFRSTIGHNTVEIGGRDQSQQSGPFMWARQARTQADRSPSDTADGAGPRSTTATSPRCARRPRTAVPCGWTGGPRHRDHRRDRRRRA